MVWGFFTGWMTSSPPPTVPPHLNFEPQFYVTSLIMWVGIPSSMLLISSSCVMSLGIWAEPLMTEGQASYWSSSITTSCTGTQKTGQIKGRKIHIHYTPLNTMLIMYRPESRRFLTVSCILMHSPFKTVLGKYKI